MHARLWATLTLLAACEAKTPAPVSAPAAGAGPRAHEALAAQGPAPVQGKPAAAEPVAPQAPTGERRFGGAPKLPGAAVPVEQVLAAPEPHLGQAIKCEGKVARVCERAGCWLELQPTSGGDGLRVPMAGHAFFIPQDAVGHLAVVEGDLRRSQLPPSRRDHYQSEGMQALGPLSLEATSVIVR